MFAEKSGKRTVVTHMSKKTRGEVTKFLVMQTKNPKTAQELQKLVAKAFKCELVKPEGKKIEAVIPTKNGWHLITGKFDVKTFNEKFPDIDIQKKNPTLLYLPNSLENNII